MVDREYKIKKWKTDSSFFDSVEMSDWRIWGCEELDTESYSNGRWNPEESALSINYLELLAIFYALQSLNVHHCNVHIEIQSDNISAIKYINDMGGMTSTSMDLLAKDIWQWCIERKINLSAIHVPGVLNTADFY